jgi:hypothetical protein
MIRATIIITCLTVTAIAWPILTCLVGNWREGK